MITKNLSNNDFENIPGITGEIRVITTDQNGNIYAANVNGEIYQCLKDTNQFELFKKINCFLITSLVFDKANNLYVLFINDAENRIPKLYKYLSDSDKLVEIIGLTNHAYNLTIDANNVLYAFDRDSLILQCEHERTYFTKLATVTGMIRQIFVDSNDNLYVLALIANENPDATDNISIIYRKNGGLSEFNEVGRINAEVNALTVDSENNIYAGTSFYGQVYRCLANTSKFVEIDKVDNSVSNYGSIVADNLCNIYLSTNLYDPFAVEPWEDQKFFIYHLPAGSSKFTKLDWVGAETKDLTFNNNLYAATKSSGVFVKKN